MLFLLKFTSRCLRFKATYRLDQPIYLGVDFSDTLNKFKKRVLTTLFTPSTAHHLSHAFLFFILPWMLLEYSYYGIVIMEY